MAEGDQDEAGTAQELPCHEQPVRWQAWRQLRGISKAPLLRPLGYYCCLSALACTAQAQSIPPGLLETAVLAPNQPYHAVIGIGQAKFLRFSCMGGPADAVLSLRSYSEHSDGLLLMSLNPDQPPTFRQHSASSYDQWQEDTAGARYVLARGVGPRGGIVGVVNMKHFAGQVKRVGGADLLHRAIDDTAEVLDAILSIRCSYMVAIDGLFWDHLRSNEVCPIGDDKDTMSQGGGDWCSGHGRCISHGVCECDGDRTGPACESEKTDLVVQANGRYRFQLATGRYRYFRIRVPAKFRGGYLKVEVTSEAPLVLLVRADGLPTKSKFDLSNFDDWVNQRNSSSLKFKVDPGSGAGVARAGRRMASIDSVYDAIDEVPAETRELAFDQSTVSASCPVAPQWSGPMCSKPDFSSCESNCMHCIECVEMHKRDDACVDECKTCVQDRCMDMFAQCAGDLDCGGTESDTCEEQCDGCMSCMSSNDADCSHCECCQGCLPWAAKCGKLSQEESKEPPRFVFVAIFNHRWYHNDREIVDAMAQIKLTEDTVFYEREQLPKSWIGDLYDPFQSMSELDDTQRQVYPQGKQFIYNIQLSSGEPRHLEVSLFRDRLTLVRIHTTTDRREVDVSFTSGDKITHVLTSSVASPKTLFDFDQVHLQDGQEQQQLRFYSGKSYIWCALFGAVDGHAELSLRNIGDVPPPPLPMGFVLVFLVSVTGVLAVLWCIYNGASRVGEQVVQIAAPLSERFASLVRSARENEESGLLGSCGSYRGSDVIDRSVEDRYLHRGGFGDDGI
eukprot:gnl/TRDRNA2_/TRDRNA2_94971_c0_seq1.p1 gnl/TRDRNA2_/TRDRNA2_94971_c0~~gnl/TRDRNA2_/TRDRNA2_94971_c0_seq1.p1  ORF type:complete len:824 (+),score=125.52 gnl/TRDRNA2_/TRDRNA2_94971_c0_seq1:114-2474(+)